MQNMLEPTTESTQRLNVDLPASQYLALKTYALHSNTTVSQLVRDALQQFTSYDAWFRQRVDAARADQRLPIDSHDWQTIKQAKLDEQRKLANTSKRRKAA